MKNTVTITFTLNGTVYTANGTKNHCYRWQEGFKGQRVRIKKDEFEAAEQQYNDECKARIEAEAAKEIALTPNPTVDGWDAMLEDEEPKKAKKRTRKSKDVAFTYSENGEPIVTLTAKQVDFVKHLKDTCFWENGLDSTPWIDILCDEIGGQFAGKPMTVGAMISTLCEKGLAERAKDRITDMSTGRTRTATYMFLTELGKTVFATGWGLN